MADRPRRSTDLRPDTGPRRRGPDRNRLRQLATPGPTARFERSAAAAKLAANLPERLTRNHIDTLSGWSSFAQFVGNRPVPKPVIDAWPGYALDAAMSSVNAYYTDPATIAAVWDWLEKNHVTGHGFEPGCGRGDWILAAPQSATFDAVDIDPISVIVARALTGENIVQERLENWTLTSSPVANQQHGYDFVVGNVPFAAARPGVGNPHNDNLHNLAIARSVDMLRPGGVAALITSRYSLDSLNNDWRHRIAEQVDLIAALRLPSGTHREAGTQVVTDLLVLRRPHTGEQRPAPTWLHTTDYDLGDNLTATVNQYWLDHPEHVLGRIETGGAYRAESFSVRSNTPTAERVASALGNITFDFAPNGAAPAEFTAGTTQHRTATGRSLPAGSIVVDPTSPTGFRADLDEHRSTNKHAPELARLCQLRDVVLAYYDDPTTAAGDEVASLYHAYADHYGPLNRYTIAATKNSDETDNDDGEQQRARRVFPHMGGFRKDPSWWSVAAIESFDDETQTARLAPAFAHGHLEHADTTWPEHADTIHEAVATSLARHHRIDPNYIAQQLNLNLTQTHDNLTDIAFQNPEGEWIVNDLYLTGDVRTKLDAAIAALDTNPSLQRNVDALTKALPPPLTPAEISAELGVTWIEPDDITDFIVDNGGPAIKIMYHPPTGIWSLDDSTWHSRKSPASFRTDRYDMAEQVVRALNADNTTVTHEITHTDGTSRRVIDEEATAAEQVVRENLNEAFGAWVWSDPERSQRLAAEYNRRYNRHVPEHWNGSHLTLPGLAADFTPRPHQKDVVWRVLGTADKGVLIAHGVGAGKTAAMIIASHETRRTGRINGTTMFAVPGNMIEQFARDYLALYPAARIITPQGNTRRDAVRQFAARVATGDFDAAICSHRDLASIPLSPDIHRAHLAHRIADFDTDLDTKTSRKTAKRVARRIDKMRAQLATLANETEDPAAVYFDRLNIGMLVVDEAHLAKNITLVTNHSGLPIPTPSQLAESILARADHIRDRHGPTAVLMATATPITNSPAEMWVAARLIAPNLLDTVGLRHFDAFAANFLSPIASVEFDASGRLKVVERLAEYRNFPDLAQIFRSFTDVRPSNTLGFALPELAGGKAFIHTAAASNDQRDVAKWAAERASGLHLHKPDDTNDPVIAILGVNRQAALHPMIINPESLHKWATMSYPSLSFEHEPTPKLVVVADNIAEIYHRTSDWTYNNSPTPGAAQAVFCDSGTPKPGNPAVYGMLTDMLTQRGVPAQQIDWAHNHDPSRRQQLYERVRNGQVRVLFGSTHQMGVGVNIQNRLYAVHELTAPYRPDWLEQAEGRLIRQGNPHEHVEVHRYVSNFTGDAQAWKILERKANFITQAMSNPDRERRDLRDDSTQSSAEEFAEIAAIATGDPRHIELASITAEVTRLERRERVHAATLDGQQRSIGHLNSRISTIHTQLEHIQQMRPDLHITPNEIGAQIQAFTQPLQHRYRDTPNITVAGIEWHTLNHGDGWTFRHVNDVGANSIVIDTKQLHSTHHASITGIGTQFLNRSDPVRLRRNLEIRLAETNAQLESEHTKPVPTTYPEAAQLELARARQTELTTALSANTVTETAAQQLSVATPQQPHTTPTVTTIVLTPTDPNTAQLLTNSTQPQPTETTITRTHPIPNWNQLTPHPIMDAWVKTLQRPSNGGRLDIGRDLDPTAWIDMVTSRLEPAADNQWIRLGQVDALPIAAAKTGNTATYRIAALGYDRHPMPELTMPVDNPHLDTLQQWLTELRGTTAECDTARAALRTGPTPQPTAHQQPRFER